jgi:hypothetical protein
VEDVDGEKDENRCGSGGASGENSFCAGEGVLSASEVLCSLVLKRLGVELGDMTTDTGRFAIVSVKIKESNAQMATEGGKEGKERRRRRGGREGGGTSRTEGGGDKESIFRTLIEVDAQIDIRLAGEKKHAQDNTRNGHLTPKLSFKLLFSTDGSRKRWVALGVPCLRMWMCFTQSSSSVYQSYVHRTYVIAEIRVHKEFEDKYSDTRNISVVFG